MVMTMMIIVTITNMMMTVDHTDYDEYSTIASANKKARTLPIHFLMKKIH